jgi:hypothetical protein
MNNFSTIELTPVKKGEHYNPDQVFIVASAMTGFSDSPRGSYVYTASGTYEVTETVEIIKLKLNRLKEKENK